LKHSKYSNLAEWRQSNLAAYNSAVRKGLLSKLCEEFGWKMPRIRTAVKPKGYWTLKLCQVDAKKFQSKADWRRASSAAYKAAFKNNWLEKCCDHMIAKRSWSLQDCKLDAKKYKTRTEWKSNSTGYNAAHTNGWLDICCKHMSFVKLPNGYWTKEMCIKDAKKYNSRYEWQKSSASAYNAALKNTWFVECCTHMK